MKKFISLLVATLTLIGFQMIATADADVTSGVLSIKDVDTAPVPVKQEGPIVGDDIKGIAAMVHISFVIDENGNVQNPSVMKSTDERLNVAALETVQKWHFKPAENGGNKVPVRAVVPIRFKA